MKRDLYLDAYTFFKSNLINNMDHMRISDTEPSSLWGEARFVHRQFAQSILWRHVNCQEDDVTIGSCVIALWFLQLKRR